MLIKFNRKFNNSRINKFAGVVIGEVKEAFDQNDSDDLRKR